MEITIIIITIVDDCRSGHCQQLLEPTHFFQTGCCFKTRAPSATTSLPTLAEPPLAGRFVATYVCRSMKQTASAHLAMLTTIGVSLGGPIAADISASFLALSSCCVRLATNRNPKICCQVAEPAVLVSPKSIPRHFGRKDFLPVEPQSRLSFPIHLSEPRLA